jgi:hypothetical protein
MPSYFLPRRQALIALVLCLLVPGGCGIFGRPDRGPVPPPVSAPEVIDAVREDTRRFTTLVDTDIGLSIAARQNEDWKKLPTFGGLLALDSRRPGLWLRAEKLTQKIFTLRAGSDYFWLEIPDTKEIVTGGPLAYDRLPHLVQPTEVMLWFAAPEWLGLTWDGTRMSIEPEYYRFDVELSGETIRSVLVDRRTLNLACIEVYDMFGRVHAEVWMEGYRNVQGVDFPYRMRVLRPRHGYRIRLKLDNPKFNKDIPGRAFEPKKRPGWRHINLDYQPLSAVKAFSGER